MQDMEHPEILHGRSVSTMDSDIEDLLANTRSILESLDLGSLLTRLADALVSLVEIDALSLKLHNVTEELLLIRRLDSFKREMVFGSRVMSAAGVSRTAMESGTPILIEDIERETRYAFPSYVGREGFKSLVAVPLVMGTRKMGMVTIYLRKKAPVSPQVLAIISIVASVAAAAVENSELVNRIETNYFSTVEALAAAIEAKDPYTRGHSKRVTQFAIVLAERFGVPETDIRNLRYGATLHDIGKIGVSGKILNKKGRLTAEEFDAIKQHPLIGENIIGRVDFLQGARPIVRSHHERFDGSGYPDGLSEEEIPFLARVVAVIDFYDALTSDRPYRKAYSLEQTLHIIREGIGREFDPMVAVEFLEMSSCLAKSSEAQIGAPDGDIGVTI
jgi:HD-GYP domain-containing protein (c-di-GMP phosphodiesterase class II)